MTLTDLIRQRAALAAPTMTVDQLTARLNACERLIDITSITSDLHTAAGAAWDVFTAELDRRFPAAPDQNGGTQ